MTLILTYLSQTLVTQVSDTRISYVRGGTVIASEDIARKCLFYESPDSRLAIAYTGCAAMAEHRGDPVSLEDWLCREIPSFPPGTSLPQVIARVVPRLDEAIGKTAISWPLTHQQRHLSVVLTGFWAGDSSPLVVCISNFETTGHSVRKPGEVGPPVRPITPKGSQVLRGLEFTATATWFRRRANRVLAHGDLRGLTRPLTDRLGWKVRRALHLPRQDRAAGITGALVDTLRAAAANTSPSTVSRDCWSYSLQARSLTVEFNVHRDREAAQTVNPRLLAPGLLVESWISQDGIIEPMVRDCIEKINVGDLNIPISPGAVRAYVEASPRYRSWTDYVTNLGLEVVTFGQLSRTADMLRKAGIATLADLDQLIQAAEGWGHSLVAEYLENSRQIARELTPQAASLKQAANRDAVLCLLVIGARPDIFTDGVLQQEFDWGRPEAITGPARRWSPNI